jgi:SAM-dependent methyltransferase
VGYRYRIGRATRLFRDFVKRLGSAADTFAVPLFLLEPPKDKRIPFRFESPSLAEPCSQTCTENQFAEPLYFELSEVLELKHRGLHRKAWEFVWIAAVLKKAALLREGNKGIGFGVGGEPLPAFFASHGVQVVATDAPPAAINGQGWDVIGQHAVSLEPLKRPQMLDNGKFDRLVQFEPVDMNNIPPHLKNFDFCWSACCFEHLGSIELGLNFVEQSLKTLRPGGLAVHTTEFNLSSNEATLEIPTLSLFRKRDIEALYGRLIAAGHKVWPLNLHPGTGPADAHIDLPPYGSPHLKLLVRTYATTSIGLVVEKGH